MHEEDILPKSHSNVLRWFLVVIAIFYSGNTYGEGLSLQNWSEVEKIARGQTVDWYAWGGDESINGYIAWIGEEVERRYGVKLNHVKIADTQLAVNKVIGEVQAGKEAGGSVDLIWINGENFRTLKHQNLLYGPLLPALPNSRFFDVKSPLIQWDFGYPTEGYEAPWGSAQFVFIYDTARMTEPPRSIEALGRWIRAHPGKFTYPAPPHFLGTTFLKHIMYAVDGGPDNFVDEPTDQTYREKVRHTWQFLKELKPNLWREGSTYPETPAQLDTLFANQEVHFSMDFHPASSSNKIDKGIFPPTTRTFVLDEGTIANTHFVAIPLNAADKAGAAVLANFLISPEAQLKKGDSSVWGDFTVLEMSRLPEEWRERFENQPRGIATLSPAELNPKLPEPPAGWGIMLEKNWRIQVFQ